jgi:hypothetical protein
LYYSLFCSLRIRICIHSKKNGSIKKQLSLQKRILVSSWAPLRWRSYYYWCSRTCDGIHSAGLWWSPSDSWISTKNLIWFYFLAEPSNVFVFTALDTFRSPCKLRRCSPRMVSARRHMSPVRKAWQHQQNKKRVSIPMTSPSCRQTGVKRSPSHAVIEDDLRRVSHPGVSRKVGDPPFAPGLQ